MYICNQIESAIAFQIGPLKIHWYGLAYAFAFLIAWTLISYQSKKSKNNWSSEQISDLVFYFALSGIIGARVGYMLFYNLSEFINNPQTVFKVWLGGMSFHGGMIGAVIGMLFFIKRYKKGFFEVSDLVVPAIPIGIGLGRLGNFVNCELWGRVSNVPWSVVYTNAGPYPRHPSEIYEFFVEGVVLFFVIWIFRKKPRPEKATSAVFLIGYGLARIICEFFREPDIQLGFIASNWLTMGQLLSAPIIIIGFILLFKAYEKRKNNETVS